MYKNVRRRQHFLELARLVGGDAPEHTLALAGETIYKKLLRIERNAHRTAERNCDDETMTEDRLEHLEQRYTREVKEVLGFLPKGFFINPDPRGYALKVGKDAGISCEDFGGYGILAPDF